VSNGGLRSPGTEAAVAAADSLTSLFRANPSQEAREES
jgi:hypothetical protein